MDYQQPYFMQNEDWYYYDIETGTYKLTASAPEKARESYKEFYAPGAPGDQMKKIKEELNNF